MLCPKCKSDTKIIMSNINGKQTAIIQCVKCPYWTIIGKKIKNKK